MKEMKYLPERLKKPEVLLDTWEEGLRIIILSLGTHPCAYVGIPLEHPLAGFNYDDLDFIECHGGFTFSEAGDDKYLPKGFWWYGWDYAHVGDWMGYYKEGEFRDYKKWTTEEIYEEAKLVAWDMRKLMNLIEKIIKQYHTKGGNPMNILDKAKIITATEIITYQETTTFPHGIWRIKCKSLAEQIGRKIVDKFESKIRREKTMTDDIQLKLELAVIPYEDLLQLLEDEAEKF